MFHERSWQKTISSKRRCRQRSDTVHEAVYEAIQEATHEAVQEEHFRLMNHPLIAEGVAAKETGG